MKVSGSRALLSEPPPAIAAIGVAIATSAIAVSSRPRPPLPQSAFERDSPPRLPVPHSALERLPLGASKFLRAILSPFRAEARAACGDRDAHVEASQNRAQRRLRPA